jgi:hypothetical protein
MSELTLAQNLNIIAGLLALFGLGLAIFVELGTRKSKRKKKDK